MSLPQYIKDITNITPLEEEVIDSLFEREEFLKGQFLLREGNVARHIFFIEKGLVRVFRHSEEGKEVTAFFCPENTFVTAFDSFYTQRTTNYNLVLLEDSVIYSFTAQELEEMITKSNAMAKLLYHTTYDLARKMSMLLASVKFRTAEERYKLLLHDFPNVFQRAPLIHIASFLGITPETLSRMRAQI